MTTETMIERVARAVAETANRQPWDITQDAYVHDCDPLLGRILAKEIARAALVAVLEPNVPEGLAVSTFADGKDPLYAEDFRAMIQAALDGQ